MTEALKLAPKQVGAGLAALGAMAMAASGALYISTPEAQECAVELARAEVRLELHADAMDLCEVALSSCNGDSK